MIQTVFSAALPVGESLVVRKNRIGEHMRSGPRIAVITGMHGDELEGQYVAFELARRLTERPADLHGMVDIYPAVNPLGLSSHERGVPQFDIDLDRTFPGDKNGSLTEVLADALVRDLEGTSVCIDIHSSSIYTQELTQIRIDEHNARPLVRLAALLNARLVWTRKPVAARESTLSHTLNERGIPTLVVDMGAGMRLDEEAGSWLVEGILRLLEHLHAWTGPTIALPNPLVSNGSNVCTLRCESPGIFLPSALHGNRVQKGSLVGSVCDPLSGTVRQQIVAPCTGLLFTLRTYPVVYPGSLLARILEVRI